MSLKTEREERKLKDFVIRGKVRLVDFYRIGLGWFNIQQTIPEGICAFWEGVLLVEGLSKFDVSKSGADLGSILTVFQNERRRRKLLGGSEACTPVNFFFFSLPKVTWVIQSGYWPDFNLESFFFHEKFIYLWKLWPIFVKRWKPVWIRACKYPASSGFSRPDAALP